MVTRGSPGPRGRSHELQRGRASPGCHLDCSEVWGCWGSAKVFSGGGVCSQKHLGVSISSCRRVGNEGGKPEKLYGEERTA